MRHLLRALCALALIWRAPSFVVHRARRHRGRGLLHMSAIDLFGDGSASLTLGEAPQGADAERRPSAGDRVGLFFNVSLAAPRADDPQQGLIHWGNEVYDFTIGRNPPDGIAAWEKAVPRMCLGQRARIVAEAKRAFGEEGAPPLFPPRETLVFDLLLTGWESPMGSVTGYVPPAFEEDGLMRDGERREDGVVDVEVKDAGAAQGGAADAAGAAQRGDASASTSSGGAGGTTGSGDGNSSDGSTGTGGGGTDSVAGAGAGAGGSAAAIDDDIVRRLREQIPDAAPGSYSSDSEEDPEVERIREQLHDPESDMAKLLFEEEDKEEPSAAERERREREHARKKVIKTPAEGDGREAPRIVTPQDLEAMRRNVSDTYAVRGVMRAPSWEDRAPSEGEEEQAPLYEFVETKKAFELLVPIPAGTRGREVQVDIGRRSVAVTVRGEPLLREAETEGVLLPADSFWLINEDRFADRPWAAPAGAEEATDAEGGAAAWSCLEIELKKAPEDAKIWGRVFAAAAAGNEALPSADAVP